MDYKKNEWDTLPFPGQKERLIQKVSDTLEQITAMSELKLLSEDITLAETFHHSYRSGIDAPSHPCYDTLKLTKDGIVEDYYQTDVIKRKILFIPIPITKHQYCTRIVSKNDFPSVVEKYRLGLTDVRDLRSALEF
jgi:hypothetical protein